MARNDMAFVIGIARYPTFGGNASDAARDLQGPVNDADAFVDWLKAPDGGDVPEAHIFAVTSDHFPAGAPVGPVVRDVTDKLDALRTAAKAPPRKRRLYIYTSGHGFGRRRLEGGLYLADAAPANLSNFFVSDYFNWFLDAAYFDECILFSDACMDQGRLAAPAQPHWRREIAPGRGTSAMGAYAARFAGRAVEGRMANGLFHGAFSYALRMGLLGAAAVVDPQGKRKVTGDSLRDYLIATMQKLMTEAERQDPRISTDPDFGPFDPVTLVEDPPPFERPVTVLLPGAVADATLNLENAAFDNLGPVTAANGSLALSLRPGLYALTSSGGWEGAFEFTGVEQEISLR
ncbi:caspase family protein [Marivita sp. GX14005]|uniref:caspase family protein n=1 Tax=Marivita sp. GX14005 TaxID=2942276 RepID=UPI0020195C05|nr:caspase family protein [Marivita sp. GX14005]MCL3882684.1 caspase family protein [Marivita sp. GX14005]